MIIDPKFPQRVLLADLRLIDSYHAEEIMSTKMTG